MYLLHCFFMSCFFMVRAWADGFVSAGRPFSTLFNTFQHFSTLVKTSSLQNVTQLFSNKLPLPDVNFQTYFSLSVMEKVSH